MPSFKLGQGEHAPYHREEASFYAPNETQVDDDDSILRKKRPSLGG